MTTTPSGSSPEPSDPEPSDPEPSDPEPSGSEPSGSESTGLVHPGQVVVRLTNPPDIVAAMPVFIGFHPDESLVVMCLQGARRRNRLTMRVDLPEPEYEGALAADMAERAARESADAVLVLCYTEAPDRDGALPRQELIDRLLELLTERGIEHGEVLLVRDGRWYSYVCASSCCPREGTPVPDRASSDVTDLAAQAALIGRNVLPSRQALVESIRGPRAVREAVLRDAYGRAGAAFVEDVQAEGADTVLDRTLELAHRAFDRYLKGEPALPDADAVRILVGLEDKLARDSLLVWALNGQIEELLVFLTDLARRALDDNAAPVCTVLAGVAYLIGDGALAGIALDRALAAEPDYELAKLLDAALRNQISPAEIRAMTERTRDQLREWGIDNGAEPAAA
jgi:Domain of unknown function (DUF4192)